MGTTFAAETTRSAAPWRYWNPLQGIDLMAHAASLGAKYWMMELRMSGEIGSARSVAKG